MKRIILASCIAALALFVGLNIAAAADPAAGKALAKKCSCHNAKKNLDGMDAKKFTGLMMNYKGGKGEPKSMIGIAQKLSDADIQDLAAYYSGLK